MIKDELPYFTYLPVTIGDETYAVVRERDLKEDVSKLIEKCADIAAKMILTGEWRKMIKR